MGGMAAIPNHKGKTEMKKILFASVAAMGLTVSACDSAAENQAEDQIEATEEAADAEIEAMEDAGAMTDAEADSAEAAVEAEADAAEDAVDAADPATAAEVPAQ